MSHPTADDRTASLFQESNLKGTKLVRQADGVSYHEYPKHVADEYKSLSVGFGSKAHFWYHLDTSQRKDLEAGDYNDLKAQIGSLTCYSVDPDDTKLVEFTFVDPKSSEVGAYLLIMQVYNVGEAQAPSNDGKYHIAGKISGQTGDVVTAVKVRQKDGQFIANGSVYFVWDPKTQTVNIDDKAGQWPSNLKIDKVTDDRFKVTLLSK